jgi:hypothetical protein
MQKIGLKTADEITAMYEAEELSTTEAIMLININRRYRRDMTETELDYPHLYRRRILCWFLGLEGSKHNYRVFPLQLG